VTFWYWARFVLAFAVAATAVLLVWWSASEDL
jgi:hypothetical protein